MNLIRRIPKWVLVLGATLAVVIVCWRGCAILVNDGGTGEEIVSPNGAYVASAMEFWHQDFWGYNHHWFELEVMPAGSKQPIHRLRLDSIPGPYLYFGSRSQTKVVFWNDSSSEVRFVFPAAEFVLKPGVR